MSSLCGAKVAPHATWVQHSVTSQPAEAASTKRVAAAVLIGAVPPILVKSAANPEGIPIEVFDGLRSSLAKDRSQFWKDFAIMFYGANRPGAKVSQGMLDQFWLVPHLEEGDHPMKVNSIVGILAACVGLAAPRERAIRD